MFRKRLAVVMAAAGLTLVSGCGSLFDGTFMSRFGRCRAADCDCVGMSPMGDGPLLGDPGPLMGQPVNGRPGCCGTLVPQGVVPNLAPAPRLVPQPVPQPVPDNP